MIGISSRGRSGGRRGQRPGAELSPGAAVDHGVARQAVEGIQATEARTDIGSGLRERKAVGRALRGTKQIFVFTDAGKRLAVRSGGGVRDAETDGCSCHRAAR